MPVQDDSTEESVYDEVSSASFTPYDPEAVQPTSSSPAPQAPNQQPGEIGDTSGEDGEAGASQAQDPQETPPPPIFDERFREPFTGLMYLGAVQDHFTAWGHEFVIRTLTTEDIAEVGLITKRYEGTIAANAVYQAATVAAAIVTVDGKPLPLPLEQGDSGLQFRFDYVAKKWFPPVRQIIWNRYFALEQMVNEVIEAMGKVSG